VRFPAALLDPALAHHHADHQELGAPHDRGGRLGERAQCRHRSRLELGQARGELGGFGVGIDSADRSYCRLRRHAASAVVAGNRYRSGADRPE
jgi:hypothetical protein